MSIRAIPGGPYLLSQTGGALIARKAAQPFKDYILSQAWEFTGGVALRDAALGSADEWRPRLSGGYDAAHGVSHLNDQLDGALNPFFSAAYADNTPFINRDGEVILRGAPTPSALLVANGGTQPYAYSTGFMTTANGFAQQYGFFEARIKIPSGKGMWPAFCMMPADNTGPPELDIFEIIPGTYPSTVFCTYHWGLSYGTDHQFDQTACSTWADGTPLPALADDYHEYAVDWTATTLDWYLDRKLLVSKSITPGALPQYQKPFYIIVNLAIGGAWPGAPDASTLFPADMHVDWVRAWRLS